MCTDGVVQPRFRKRTQTLFVFRVGIFPKTLDEPPRVAQPLPKRYPHQLVHGVPRPERQRGFVPGEDLAQTGALSLFVGGEGQRVEKRLESGRLEEVTRDPSQC